MAEVYAGDGGTPTQALDGRGVHTQLRNNQTLASLSEPSVLSHVLLTKGKLPKAVEDHDAMGRELSLRSPPKGLPAGG